MNNSGMAEAIATAKVAVQNIYEDEKLTDMDVEEVEWDSEDWLITLGFTSSKTKQIIGGLTIPNRRLRRVRVDRQTGAFKGMTRAPTREG